MSNARPFLDKGVFKQLQDIQRFKIAHVAFDAVCWPGELDIAPETLYDKSFPVTALDGLSAAIPINQLEE